MRRIKGLARCTRVLRILLLGAPVPSVVAAQEGGFTLGGEVGARLEVDGRPDQEGSPSVGRLSLRPTVSLGGRLTMGFDLLVTTPTGSRQPRAPNEYSVRLDWGGARADIGNFTQSYSPLALQDVSMRGARFFAQRHGVRLSAVSGRSTGRNDFPRPFDRHLHGGRVGVGDTTSLALDVIMVRAQDDMGPLVASTATAGGIAPQRSLVAGAVAKAAIAGKALSLRGEIMRSDFTPDLNVHLRPGETPDAGSSSVDYAHSLEATARVASLTARATYRNVGAGYRVLGVPWLATDRREVGLSATTGFAGWNVDIDASRHRDNLSGEQGFTTAFTRLGARLAFPRLKSWSTILRAEHLTRSNDSPDPDRWSDERTWLLGTHQRLDISQKRVVRSASVGYEYEVRRDANALRVGSEADSHTLNVEMRTSLTDGLQVNPSFRLVRSSFAVAPRTVHRIYAMEAHHRTMGGRLRLALSLRRTEHRDAAWWGMAMDSRFLLGADLDR